MPQIGKLPCLLSQHHAPHTTRQMKRSKYRLSCYLSNGLPRQYLKLRPPTPICLCMPMPFVSSRKICGSHLPSAKLSERLKTDSEIGLYTSRHVIDWQHSTCCL